MTEKLYTEDNKKRWEIEIDGKRWDEIQEKFETELAKTAPHINLGDKTPRFTEPHGEFLYARLRAVHSHCESWDNLKTVWISLTANEKDSSDNWVHPLRHDDGFRSEAVKKSISRARRSLDVKRWAGYWVMSPRLTGYSHKHYALWLDTKATVEEIAAAFAKPVESHIRSHPTASSEGNPTGKAVQVKKDDECKKLIPEIGRNIPDLWAETDVRNITDKQQIARVWAAMYWFDDRIRQYELGQFSKIADDAREESRPDSNWVFGNGWQK